MDRLEAEAIVLTGVDVRVVERCTSTNDVLLKLAAAPTPVLLAAEVQSAGRGRRGRRWHSKSGAGITFSLAQRIARPVREMAAVSLVAGAAIAGVLRRLGASDIALKWPNDLVAGNAKLGGILVETRAAGKETLAVIGVGINCHGQAELERTLQRRVASLDQFLRPMPTRNEMIGKIGAALLEALAVFQKQGLDGMRHEWEAMDAHAGRRLRVRLANGRVVTGIAAGLAQDGALRLRTRAGMRDINSGRVVSSRAA
jgi:BirA family biotin operon repressor/biotin-[acetyl-CoA-carboxylase] ligase